MQQQHCFSQVSARDLTQNCGSKKFELACLTWIYRIGSARSVSAARFWVLNPLQY